MTTQHRALALLPLCLLLAACPRVPVDFGKDGEPKSAEELLKRIAVAESQIVTLKGDGKLGVNSPQGNGSVTLFVAVTHPSNIHLEQLDFFGRPQGVLVTDGERFGLYNGQDAKYYRGPASPANLARFLPVVMPPAELAALLLGRMPRIRADATEMTFDDKEGVFVLKLVRGEIVQTVQVKPPTYRVVKSTVVGLKAYDVEFGDIGVYGAVSIPKKAKLVAASAKTSVELTYKDITINEPPDLTLFDMAPPEGVPVVEVDAQGNPR